MFIKNFSAKNVRTAENLSKTAAKLCLNLLDVFITKETLAESLVTDIEGRKMLDQDIIEGIRCENLFSIYT